jgi:hypothetical protein
MRYLDRLLSLFLFGWMSQPLRQLRRAATVTGVVVAFIAAGPLWANAQDQFGEVHFPVSCDAGVQKKVDLALAMLHAFSFPAAAKTFEAVSREDPDCAMAYWGIAATAVGSLYGGRPGRGSERSKYNIRGRRTRSFEPTRRGADLRRSVPPSF